MKIGNASVFIKSLDKSIKEHLENVSGGIEKYLDKNDSFTFSCSRQNICCINRDDNPIILSPYDAYVIRKSLDISSDQFLSNHARLILGSKSKYPMLILNNKSVNNKFSKCEFLDIDGCSIYEIRPTVCRMFPIGRISDIKGTSYFFLVKSNGCCKTISGEKHNLEAWLKESKIDEFIDWNDKFQGIIYEMDHKKYQNSHINLKLFLGEILYNYDNIKNIPHVIPLINNSNSNKEEIETIFQLAKNYTKLMFGK